MSEWSDVRRPTEVLHLTPHRSLLQCDPERFLLGPLVGRGPCDLTLASQGAGKEVVGDFHSRSGDVVVHE